MLTEQQAFEVVERMRSEWIFLGATDDMPTFLCPRCGRQRITLKTPDAVLPTNCPKCEAALTAPDWRAKLREWLRR